jgi:hypothetical protein
VKQALTLFAALACFVLTSFGQTSENFESVTSLSSLTNNCWQFSGAYLSTASVASEARSIGVKPGSNGTSASISTPFVNLTTSSFISFVYKAGSTLSAGASRIITVRLQGIDGLYTTVGTTTLDGLSTTALQRFSRMSPISGVQRVVISVTGSGDAATSVYLDNIMIAGTFNYSGPYDCKSQSEAKLSIHYLKTFQGVVAGDQVQLKWTVVENENNNYFEVEKSADGREYKSIARINATQKVAVENYSFTDDAQGRAFYRLKVVSKNNVRMFSNVLVFKNETAAGRALNLLQNPVQQSVKISFVSEGNLATTLSVYHLSSGSKVFETTIPSWKGANVITTPLDAQLKAGMYLLEIKQSNYRSTVVFLKE